LVASPTLVDPNFDRRVVLMLEHTPEGALGLVLNDPMAVLSVDALPDPLAEAFSSGDLVHCGGPVERSAVIVLADVGGSGERVGTSVFEGISILDPNEEIELVLEAVLRLRAFAGYAGWSAGQLEQEIEEGAWINVPPAPSDVFTLEADHLWTEVLERAGGSYRLVARMPPDPTMN
jgi:putative transcriptional regulator